MITSATSSRKVRPTGNPAGGSARRVAVTHDNGPVDRPAAAKSTGDRLLDAAERLFGEHGLHGVSLRAIMNEAGANPAAVHYHFGSKEALVEAVVVRRIDLVTRTRNALLDAAGPASRIDDVIGALVRSLADIVSADDDAGRSYVRFLARLFADRSSPLVTAVLRHHRPHMTRLARAISAALPDVPPHVVAVRSSIAFDVVIQEIARWNEVVQPWVAKPRAASLDDFSRHLIEFVSAGMSAPVSAADTAR